ncbi:MAG: THUMP domain-containing class I SAM-dependent RNA methyltransferase [Bacteroidales bacterium]
MANSEQFHAKTLKGFESLLAEELHGLGAERTEIGNRGVTFYGGRALLYRVNIASRLSLRVLLPVLRFDATDPETIYRKVKRYDWSVHLNNKMTFVIDAVVHSQLFTNSQFVALKVKDAIVDRFREKTGLRPSVSKDRPDLRINVHLSGRSVTVSLDSSGDSLHKRGYRKGHFEAPLNEVLAAGMIMMTGWRGETPFLDPMCGSGTLAIEAALIATGTPPGIFREHYGFETWPDFDPGLLEHVVRQLPEPRESAVPIRARDADPGAISLTRRQVKAMELDRIVEVQLADFTETPSPEPGSTLVINPPYGERLREQDLGTLYAGIGSTLKHKYPGSDAWILSSSSEAVKKIGLRPTSRQILYNGALKCQFLHYKTFSGTLKAHKSK